MLLIPLALEQEVRQKQEELGKRLSHIEDILANQDAQLKHILVFTNYNIGDNKADINVKDLTPPDVSCQDKG